MSQQKVNREKVAVASGEVLERKSRSCAACFLKCSSRAKSTSTS